MSKVITRMDIMAGSSSEIISDDIMSRFGEGKREFADVLGLSPQALVLASETSPHAMMVRRYVRELSCVSGIDEDALYTYFVERCQNSPYAIEVVYRAVHRECMATGELPGYLAWKELTEGKWE